MPSALLLMLHLVGPLNPPSWALSQVPRLSPNLRELTSVAEPESPSVAQGEVAQRVLFDPDQGSFRWSEVGLGTLGAVSGFAAVGVSAAVINDFHLPSSTLNVTDGVLVALGIGIIEPLAVVLMQRLSAEPKAGSMLRALGYVFVVRGAELLLAAGTLATGDLTHSNDGTFPALVVLGALLTELVLIPMAGSLGWHGLGTETQWTTPQPPVVPAPPIPPSTPAPTPDQLPPPQMGLLFHL
jgi:hypothetical protein